MKITSIHIYPIKSLGGISVKKANVQPRGLAYDRRFMLTDLKGEFLTQRSNAEMALLKTQIQQDQLIVWDSRTPTDKLQFPLQPTVFQKEQIVSIWEDTCIGSVLLPSINRWFSEKLGQDCQLVYMPDHSKRALDERYKKEGEIVSFADGYPILIIGDASMTDLNNRLATPVPADRFRANIFFSGGTPFEEDEWQYFSINSQVFRGAKLCTRCNVPNINQQTAQIEKEPNRTLATFRNFDKKIKFGQNICWEKEASKGKACIAVGDEIIKKPALK